MRLTYTLFFTLLNLGILFVSSLFAQNTLVDDHSDQADTNEFGSHWYYYDDNMGVGKDDRPQADPTTTPSVIDVASITKERHAFGNPNDLWEIKNYTFTFDGSSDKFATMPFTFGNNWHASYCTGSLKCAKPYVGMSTLLAPDGMFIDLTGASGVSFKIKSRSNPLVIVFKVETYDIDKDSTFAFYQTKFATSTSWESINIPFTDLGLPDWVDPDDARSFNQKKVTKLCWEILKDNNSSVVSDTLDLDDIYINDFSYTPPEPPTLIDDFEGGRAANKIGTYWYFWDDSDSSGTSKVKNAGAENQFKGSYAPGYSSAYAGIMDFAMGNTYMYPEVGMAFNFDNNLAPIDMSGATAVQFDIKASRYMTIKFRVNQSDITDYDFYSSKVEVWPVWRTVTVYLFKGDDGIKQEPLWGVDKPFAIDKLTALEWLYRKQDNPGSDQTGIVSIDNIKILGNPAGLHAPFPPVWESPEWKSIDNPINTIIKWNKVTDAVSYKLQLSKLPDFSSPLIESVLADTQSTVTLDKGTTYYCRVNVSTTSATSRWSSTNTFTSIFDTPAEPTLLAPADNATAIPVSITLSWNKTTGAATYHLLASNSSTFSSTILDTIIATDTTCIVNGLTKGTAYYWKVSASNSSGTSPFSETRSFTTIHIPPAKPVLLSPANDTTKVARDLTFSWTASPTAASYSLQVSTTPLFTSSIFNDSNLTTNTITKTMPANGTHYYWRVKAKNDGGDSGWTSSFGFITIYLSPAAPVLASPADEATGVPVSTILKWNKTASATTYQLQVSISNSFITTIKDTSGLTDTSSTVISLNKETIYFWRVRGMNPDSTGAWSIIRSFTTIINVPGVPAIVLPANKAVSIPVSTQLVWSKVSGATSYTVQLSKSPLFTDFLVNQALNTDTTLPVSSLPNNTVCYLRVQAKNAGGTGDWSLTDTFTTIEAAPGITTLISPLDNAANQSTGPVLTWTTVSSATGYRIIVASDTLFTQMVKDSSGITDTTVVIAGLLNDTRYYWQVSAFNSGGSGSWSGKRSFTTIVSLPAKVIAATIADTIRTNQISLCWHPSTPKVTKYIIEIAPNENMEGSILDTVNDTTLQLSELTDNIRFWWRVCAANDAGFGEFSEKSSFFVSIPVSIRIPEKFGVLTMGAGKIRQGIRYSLPVKCRVKISLYDFKGSLVQKMIDSDQSAGVYTLQFPGLSSGAYYMLFNAGNYRYSSKLILTK